MDISKAGFPSRTGVHDTIHIPQALRDAQRGEITNKARRDAAANRVEVVAGALADEGGLSRQVALDYVPGAGISHAPREITPAVARLLGLDVPDGQMGQAKPCLRVVTTDAQMSAGGALVRHHPGFEGAPDRRRGYPKATRTSPVVTRVH